MGNPFKALKLANRATAKLLRGDLNADFKVTQQGLDAITQNLLTTQGSLGSALSGVNRRALNAMGRIANRDAAKLENIVGRGKSAVHTRYGAAIAGTPNLFGMSETIKGSQSKVNAKTLQAGELQAKGGNEAMAILQTAAETAASPGSTNWRRRSVTGARPLKRSSRRTRPTWHPSGSTTACSRRSRRSSRRSRPRQLLRRACSTWRCSLGPT